MSPVHPVAALLTELHSRTTGAVAAQVDPNDPDTDIRVDFGDPGRFAETSAIGIGIATEDTEAVGATITPHMGSDTAAYDVLCSCKSWGGGDDDAGRLQRMARVFELLDIVAAQLPGALETLRPVGVVALRITREGYVPVVDSTGSGTFPGAELLFAVRATITRR